MTRAIEASVEPPASTDRAGATPRIFWAAESRKSGVAPARFCFFPAVTFASLDYVSLSFAGP
jgi:hypothetical protein